MRKRKTQKTKILEYLLKNKNMTVGQAQRVLKINWPCSRISEMAKEGIAFGHKDVPDPMHKGGTMRVFWLKDPTQKEIAEYLTRHGVTV